MLIAASKALSLPVPPRNRWNPSVAFRSSLAREAWGDRRNADVDVPGGWDASAFTAALAGEPFDGREYLVCGHGIYTFSRAVYHGDWMYARIHHPGVFSVPGLYNDPDLPGDGLELLHDLAADPRTTENLIGERPDVAVEMRSRLDRWKETHGNSPEAGGEDPLVKMAATDGPYMYVDPDELLACYESRGATDRPPPRALTAGAVPSSGRGVRRQGW